MGLFKIRASVCHRGVPRGSSLRSEPRKWLDVSSVVQIVADLLPRNNPQCPLNTENIKHNMLKATTTSRRYHRLRNDSYKTTLYRINWLVDHELHY